MAEQEYREALSVHLHDQRVIITADAMTTATDSVWDLDAETEYLLEYNAVVAIDQIIESLTGVDYGLNKKGIGFGRTYAQYPSLGLRLTKLEVLVVSERMIDIRVELVNKSEDKWVEEWTYSGAWTVRWDV